MAELGLFLSSNPAARETLLALGQRHQLKNKKNKKSEQVAALLFSRLIQLGLKIGGDPKSQAFARSLGDMLDKMR